MLFSITVVSVSSPIFIVWFASKNITTTCFVNYLAHPPQDSNLPPQTGPATEAGAVDPEDVPMHKISANDIQLVQNLIERCLQSYYNEPEIIESLYMNDNIEPGFTSLGEPLLLFSYLMRVKY